MFDSFLPAKDETLLPSLNPESQKDILPSSDPFQNPLNPGCGDRVQAFDKPVADLAGDWEWAMDSQETQLERQDVDRLTGEALQNFAADPDFTDKMSLAFGDNWNREVVKDLQQDWLSGDFSDIPQVQILSADVLPSANGAYSRETNTIYLSRDFLTENAANPAAVADVLLEEYGHAIDAKINAVDAAGDEGELFAKVATDKPLYDLAIDALKTEDDTNTIVVGGDSLLVEQSQIAIESFNGKLYQSHRGFDNKIYTRSSGDGVNWSDWKESGGTTLSAPALEAFNGKLYQSHRGFDNKIYTRSSTDGVNWTTWHATASGSTPDAPSLESLNGRLYQSHRGNDNKIYTRSSTDGVNWTTWYATASGSTPDAPALEAFNGKLYQSHRGTDNKIYTRSSSDGVKWSDWKESPGTTTSSPSLEAVNGKLYQSHRGTDNKIYTRSSSDGVKWTGWQTDFKGETPTAVSLASLGNKLYQTSQGLNNAIYTRSSTDGVKWTEWHATVGTTPTELNDLTVTRITSNDKSFKVDLNLFNGNGQTEQGGLDSRKDTIVVIHGWNGNDDSTRGPGRLARKIAASSFLPNSQVLTLDWKEGAKDWNLYGAAGRISAVARWGVDRLRELGIAPNKTILVGHSLGSYVAAKMGEFFGGVKEIVALDPANGGTQLDVDGDRAGWQVVPPFRNVAKSSLALVASDL